MKEDLGILAFGLPRLCNSEGKSADAGGRRRRRSPPLSWPGGAKSDGAGRQAGRPMADRQTERTGPQHPSKHLQSTQSTRTLLHTITDIVYPDTDHPSIHIHTYTIHTYSIRNSIQFNPFIDSGPRHITSSPSCYTILLLRTYISHTLPTYHIHTYIFPLHTRAVAQSLQSRCSVHC